MPQWGKAAGNYEIAGGFLSGALTFGGLLIWGAVGPLWLLAGPFLIVLGVMMLLDDILPFGRQPYAASESGGFVAGFGASLVGFIWGFLGWMLALAIIFSVLKLYYRFFRFGTRK